MPKNHIAPHPELIKSKHLIALIVVIGSIILALSLLLSEPYNMISFGVVGLVLFIFWIIYYPFWGIYFYFLVFLFQPQQLFELPIPLEKIVDGLVLVVLLMHFRFLRENLRLFKIDKALLLFLLVCFLSMLKAGDLNLAYDNFFNFFKTVILYIIISRFTRNEKELKKIIWLYMAAVLFMAGYATFQYYNGVFEVRMGIQRAIGYAGVGPNDLANTIVISMPFWVYMSRYYKKVFSQLLIALSGLLLVWTIVITGSRGGMVGALFVFFIISMFSRKRALALVGMVVLTVVVAVMMPKQYKERFETITDFSGKTGASASAYGRLNGLILGLEYMLENPIIGVGIGNFRWYFRNTGGSWSDAHNLLGKLAGELGLSGIATFVFFIFVFIRMIRHIRHRYRDPGMPRDFNFYLVHAVMLALFALFFQGLSSHNLFRFNWYIFASFLLTSEMIREKDLADKEPSLIKHPEPGSQLAVSRGIKK